MTTSKETETRSDDKRFAEILAKHGATHCPNCGKKIDRGDVAWNSGQTEWGTPNTYVEIMCARCDTEIVWFRSWYPEVNNFTELLDQVMEDWEI